MRGFALALAILAVPLGWPADAFGQDAKPTGQVGAEVSPPEDGGKNHVTIFVADQASPEGQRLASWFGPGGHPRLAAIAAASHVHTYTPSHRSYSGRFRSYVPPQQFPAVMIQRADGAVIYKASGGNLPSSAQALAEEIDYYATLQPYHSNGKTFALADSADHYGRLLPKSQWCPDGQCVPDGGGPGGPFDLFGPDGGGKSPLLDSSDLFPRPLKAVEDAVPWIVGGSVAFALLLILGFVGLCVLAAVVYYVRTRA